MVINNPIPGVIAILTASGMDLMIASLRPIAVITIKKIPERNTITRACPYVYPIPNTTVYAKNAFSPMPGAWAKGTFAYSAQSTVPINAPIHVPINTPFAIFSAMTGSPMITYGSDKICGFKIRM